jgi:hypothetical protein
VYHHQVSQALTDARISDAQRAAHGSATRSRGKVITLALIGAAVLAPVTAAGATPMHDVGSTHRAADVRHGDRAEHAAPFAITYTNPLNRSRGVGAGGGQL